MSLVLAIVAAFCSCFLAQEMSTTSTVQGSDEPTAVRIFRTLGVFPAQRMRLYLTQADGLAADELRGLLTLLDEYERRVDSAADDVRRNPPDLHTLIERAQTMAEDFDADVLERWLQEHPEAKAAIDRAADALDDISYALGGNREDIFNAAERAGFPSGRKSEGRKVIDEAFAKFQAFGQRIEQQRQELGRLPEGDPRRLEGLTIMTDVELQQLRTAASIRQRLRELIPRERHRQFDEELGKLGKP